MTPSTMSPGATDQAPPQALAAHAPLAFAAGSVLVIGSLMGAVLFAAARSDVTAPLMSRTDLLHFLLSVSMLSAGHLLAHRFMARTQVVNISPRTSMYTGAIAATALLVVYMLGMVSASPVPRVLVPLACGVLITSVALVRASRVAARH